MKLKFLLGAAIAAACCACTGENTEIGGDLIPTDQQYKVYSIEIPIDNVEMRVVDSLTGLASRMTIGAIRDEDFGLTTKGSALTLVPLVDTIDLGLNPQFKSFHFAIAADTISTASRKDAHILQNVYVYELSKAVSPNEYRLGAEPSVDRSKVITSGIPVYDGRDSLSFNFSKAFGEKMMKTISSMSPEQLHDSLAFYTNLPGIYIETDVPAGMGGRFNRFVLPIGVNFDKHYITGNVAVLSFKSDFYKKDENGKDILTDIRTGVDTSLYFYFSPVDVTVNKDSLFSNATSSSQFVQYCYNYSHHETGKGGLHDMTGPAGESIIVEGGAGVKPVIPGATLRRLALDAIAQQTPEANASNIIIVKGSLNFNYKRPSDYTELYKYPAYLAPCRATYREVGGESKIMTFYNLTDTSSETENPGKINRSTESYNPDITYQMERIVRGTTPEGEDISREDIYLMALANETDVTINAAVDNGLADMYNYLALESYFNGSYGGYGYGMGGYGYPYGYGGYGGYGYGGYGYGGYGYGYGYDDYYTYSAMAQMYANPTQTETSNTTVSLDQTRFYHAELYGPQAEEKELRPTLKLVYAIPNK